MTTFQSHSVQVQQLHVHGNGIASSIPFSSYGHLDICMCTHSVINM